MSVQTEKLNDLVSQKYDAGFYTDIDQDSLPPGLSREVIETISKKKNEPAWLLDWRLNAYDQFLKLTEPKWAHLEYKPINLTFKEPFKTKQGNRYGICVL